MRIVVNGTEREVPDGTTLGHLIGLLGQMVGHVACERNQEVVPRRLLHETVLQAGDRIEIVTFVGGG